MRHGESEANLLHVISNRGLRHGLTKKGRDEALALADRLAPVSITKLYSSPLLRAIQTTRILSECYGLAYEITDALREYDCGVLEGKADSGSWEIYNKVYRDWMWENQWKRRIEGGESFLDMKARFMPFIEQLIESCRHGSGNFVLVGHGGLYRCMLPLMLENIDFEYAASHPMENASYICAEVDMRGIVCTAWNGEFL